MDTKERKTPTRRSRPANRRSRPKRAARPAQDRRRGSSASAVQQRRRRTAPAGMRRGAAPQKRVVRAPREGIPEAVYTMPEPLRKGKFLMRLVSVAAVVAAMMMAISIFFRVDTIQVLGAEKYTAWDVSEASGIQEGDGLLTLSKARAAGKIRAALPYVDEVKISITLPGTVNIEVKELMVTYAIAAQDNSWWIISADGEAIQQVDANAASSYTRIFGVEVEAPRTNQTVAAAADAVSTETTGATEDQTQEETGQTQAGDVTLPPQVVETNAQRLEAALSILQSLERNGVIGEVSSVNVQTLTEIQLQYGQRFQVRLGTIDDLDYKIDFMNRAIRQMEDYQTGTLDVSFEFGEDVIFSPEA